LIEPVPFYRCFIRGEDFPGECIGSTGLYGFYTTRWVQAVSTAKAELEAVAALRKDPNFALPEGFTKPVSARVFVEEIVQIRKLPRMRGRGATWFTDDGEDDSREIREDKIEAARSRALSRKPARRS
jgi:hypothetical protein